MLLKSPAGEKLTRGLDGESENLIRWKDACSVYLKFLQLRKKKHEILISLRRKLWLNLF